MTCRWADPPSEALVQRIAQRTENFAGADLQALCTSAVMAAAKRAAPSLIDQLCNQQAPAAQPQLGRAVAQTQVGTEAMHLSQDGAQLEMSQQRQQELRDQEASQGLASQQARQLGHDQAAGVSQQQQHDHKPLHEASHQQQQQQRQQQQQHSSLPLGALSSLKVKACDWKAALAAAPPACSTRQAQSALSYGHAKALPNHLAPLLLPSLTQILRCVAVAQLQVTGGLRAAVGAVGGLQGSEDGESGLERVLVDAGAIERGCSAGELDVSSCLIANGVTCIQCSLTKQHHATRSLSRHPVFTAISP